ncbi:MAG TPA: hypothetical protein VGY54_14660 [Polyangiaceae bacterium]|jgi:hypothetical protein|nr:hypothetical protein [Polyangiaceae bacterium]
MRWLDSACLGLVVVTVSSKTSAGPPYVTDDPELVEYRHWEMYLASQSFDDTDSGGCQRLS